MTKDNKKEESESDGGLRTWDAIVWRSEGESGEHVKITAMNWSEAMDILWEKYGVGVNGVRARLIDEEQETRIR